MSSRCSLIVWRVRSLMFIIGLIVLVFLSQVGRTHRGQRSTAINTAFDLGGCFCASHLNQRGTGDGTRRTVTIIMHAIRRVCSDTRTGTEDITASVCGFTRLTLHVSLENPHFCAVAHMTVLTTAIDSAPDLRTGIGNCRIIALDETTDVDGRLVDIP